MDIVVDDNHTMIKSMCTVYSISTDFLSLEMIKKNYDHHFSFRIFRPKTYDIFFVIWTNIFRLNYQSFIKFTMSFLKIFDDLHLMLKTNNNNDKNWIALSCNSNWTNSIKESIPFVVYILYLMILSNEWA